MRYNRSATCRTAVAAWSAVPDRPARVFSAEMGPSLALIVVFVLVVAIKIAFPKIEFMRRSQWRKRDSVSRSSGCCQCCQAIAGSACETRTYVHLANADLFSGSDAYL